MFQKILRINGLSWCKVKYAVKCLQPLKSSHQSSLPVLNQTVHTHFVHTVILAPPSSVSPNHDGDIQSQNSSTTQTMIPAETERGVGKYDVEQLSKVLLPPDQPPDARILHLSIIGLPNAGKSTLTNSLLGWRVSSVSKKVHTTRKNTLGISTQGNTQIIFLDTPGILHPSSRRKHNLEKSLAVDPERSLDEADLVAVIVDVSNKWTCNELDQQVLRILHMHKTKPAVLILNKVDLLKCKESLFPIMRTLTQGIVNGLPVGYMAKKSSKNQKQLDFVAMFDAMQAGQQKKDTNLNENELANSVIEPKDKPHSTATEPNDQRENIQNGKEVTEEDQCSTEYLKQSQEAKRAVHGMKGWPYFKRVFMVSALSGDGLGDIKDYLIESAHPGNWDYHSSLVTTQDPREIVTMCVREKLLEHLKQEIPYNLETEIILWEVDKDGMFNVIMDVIAQSHRQLTFIIGPQGQMIQKIASEAKQEMMNTFRCEMRLKLIAKIKTKKKR